MACPQATTSRAGHPEEALVSFDCCHGRWGDSAPGAFGAASWGVTPLSPRLVRSLPSADGWMSSRAAPLGGADDVLRGDSDGQVVPVVYSAAVQLLDQHVEQIHPGEMLGERRRLLGRHRDYSLDDLNCGQTRGCSAFLLPRTLPASVRAPLRDRSTHPRGDGTAAPAAGRGGGPPRTAARGSRCPLRVRCAVLASRGALRLMTTLTLALASASAVVVGSSGTHAGQGSHQGAWTRHHESGRPRVHEV